MAAPPPRIFDPTAYRRHRRRAALTGGDIFLAEEAARHISERLSAINRNFERGLDLNSRKSLFPLIAPFADTWLRTGNDVENPSVISDDDALPFAEGSFDLIISTLSLHAANDLPGALVQIRRLLRPKGLFVGALFAGQTLFQLRHAFAAAEAAILSGTSPRVAPFADIRDLGGLLQRTGFARSVADIERTTVRYRNLDRLFADIRAMGESNALAERQLSFLSRRLFAALVEEYGARFSESDGGMVASFDIAYLTGWAEHESRPKPPTPGTAKMRLADAVKAAKRTTNKKT